VREIALTEAAGLRDRERRLQLMWAQAAGTAGPGDAASRSLIRQRAVLGALSATTTRPALVARPRLDDLLSRSCLAMLESPVPAAPGDPDDQPSPAARRAWRPPPSRRDEILDAALGLFRRHGFAGTGIDDIGAALGLAGAGVYQSYPSKADILLDAYDRAGARVAAGAEEALAGAVSAPDALSRLATSFAATRWFRGCRICLTALRPYRASRGVWRSISSGGTCSIGRP
jgi:hypothetical protein